MNFECHHCGIPFIRPYPMNITRATRPQFCSRECVAKRAEAVSEERFEARFFARITKGTSDECWLWNGRRDPNGYGRIDWKRKPRLAHRVAFFLANPDADQELKVCHSCDNPPCCNPDHLWIGTQIDNINDMIAKGRQWWRHAN